MEPALSSTYGVIVYQEQVMQISKDMCGFSGGQADTLRKAIAKKIPEVLRKLKADFIEGAIKNVGADRAVMERFWKQLEDFAAYCFNKSHAACYALIAYWTAYLKANYPTAFMAALMTSDFDNTDRLAIEIAECRHMDVEVLAPDVNESFLEFAIVPNTNQIRFGMAAIKNVGTGAVEEILRAREQDNGFASLEDFLSKVNPRIVNRKTLESLIKSGALDAFSNRAILLGNLDALVAYASRLQKQKQDGQTDLFGSELNQDLSVTPKLTLSEAVAPLSVREQLQWERELLGIYLSQHPLDDYELLLSELAVPIDQLTTSMDGKATRVGGIITDMRVIMTKNGQKMAFVKIADLKSEIELVLFPSVYQQTLGVWEKDHVVLVRGKVNARGRDGQASDELKIMVDDAREVTHEQATSYQSTGKKLKAPAPRKRTAAAPIGNSQADLEHAKRLYIRMENSEDHTLLRSLKEAIDNHRGDTEVILVLGASAQKQAIKLPMRINQKDEAIESLQTLVGAANVKLQ